MVVGRLAPHTILAPNTSLLYSLLVYLPILTAALLPCWLPPPHPFLHPLRDSRDRGSRPRTRLHHKPSHTHITQHQTALQNTAQPPHNTPPPSCPSTSFTPSPISSPPPPPAPLILPPQTPQTLISHRHKQTTEMPQTAAQSITGQLWMLARQRRLNFSRGLHLIRAPAPSPWSCTGPEMACILHLTKPE